MISKSGQSAKLLRSCYDDIDLDQSDRPAFAVRLDFNDYEAEVPQHQHKGSSSWPCMGPSPARRKMASGLSHQTAESGYPAACPTATR